MAEIIKTAADTGWRVSRYNLTASLSGVADTVIANLYSGICSRISPYELHVMDSLDTVSETHPLLDSLAQRGFIVNFDERKALEVMGRYVCGESHLVSLMICPTLGCNFDCPYCYENHHGGVMPKEVQAEVVELVRRLLKAGRPKLLFVSWFGGEPLLAPDVIEALSEKLIALAAENGTDYMARIVTNGYLLSTEIVAMLDRVKVKKAMVTLDGIGAFHDATRYLAGGGPTFERITNNLRQLHFPFPVYIRHNVHEGNRDQVEPLKAFVKEIARESGNRIFYGLKPVFTNKASRERGAQINPCGSKDPELWYEMTGRKLSGGGGLACPVQQLFSLSVDEKGNLYKCPTKLGDPEHIFGTAADWKPADPLKTAAFPDRLTCWLNSAGALDDPECSACIWLPQCRGGCPAARLEGRRSCVSWKNDPEEFIKGLGTEDLSYMEDAARQFNTK